MKGKIKNHLRLPSGFSLVEVMVAMGLMVAGMTAMMKVSDMQSQSQVNIQVANEAMLLVNQVKLQMSGDMGCQSTIMNGAGGNPGNSLSRLDQNLLTISDRTGAVILRSGDPYGRKISRVQISRRQFASFTTLPSGDGPFAFLLQLNFEGEGNIKTFSRTIDEPIYVNVASGNITGCMTAMERTLEEMKKTSCESIGGVLGVVGGNSDIWCTLPRIKVTDTLIRHNYADLHDEAGLAKDGLLILRDDSPYLQVSPGAHQIVYGSMNFSSAPAQGIRISDSLIGTYGQPNFSENSAVDYGWYQANHEQMMKHFGPGPIPALCDQNAGGITILANDGFARCLDLKNQMRCPPGPSGEPQYLKGFNNYGEAVCVPLISGNTPCSAGGELALKPNGSLYYRCCGEVGSTCSACTPSAGTWTTAPGPQQTCGCDGTRSERQICQGTSCGGSCPGGGSEGAIRNVSFSCTAPTSGCGGGSTNYAWEQTFDLDCYEDSGGQCYGIEEFQCQDTGTGAGQGVSSCDPSDLPAGRFDASSRYFSAECRSANDTCVRGETPFPCPSGTATTCIAEAPGPGGGSGGGGSGSGVTCPSGIAKYRDYDRCCPSNYPNTGTNFACCQNSAGVEICL